MLVQKGLGFGDDVVDHRREGLVFGGEREGFVLFFEQVDFFQQLFDGLFVVRFSSVRFSVVLLNVLVQSCDLF